MTFPVRIIHNILTPISSSGLYLKTFDYFPWLDLGEGAIISYIERRNGLNPRATIGIEAVSKIDRPTKQEALRALGSTTCTYWWVILELECIQNHSSVTGQVRQLHFRKWGRANVKVEMGRGETEDKCGVFDRQMISKVYIF